ncbi:hypothetical protein JI739_13275 [Ramlibacter sp. AW1]|uniref:Uncharacterized protein n=1 Tax=Ramlibacter aurantiacus TaxID=2801330 RepID=A0A937D436_9BURK|nr:hypothetical protein [Ramlibacter aurantiacus]MBL0421325.1 hypothetical protein [Ramlibacter aurantiacus]
MSEPAPRHSHESHGHSPAAAETHEPHDAVEGVIHAVPIVLPIVGGVLMFLLAWIAIYLA